MMLGDPAGGPSLGGLAGSVPGFTIAYLGAEAAVGGPMHPIHWVVAFVGGLFGYLVGHGIWMYREGLLDFPRRPGLRRGSPATRGRPRRRR